MNRHLIGRYFAILFVLAAMPALRAVDADATSPMTGHWEGSTHVIVTWCAQKQLAVSLDIHADGGVTGRIGDAALTNAQLKRKRHWFGQPDSHTTTHIIKGDLLGPIIAAEGISRGEVFIHVRLEDAHLAGGLATSGSKIDGKDSMVLTATSLWLAKS